MSRGRLLRTTTVRARDNPFAAHRIEAVTYRLRGTTWEELLSRLKALGWRAAVAGPEGSGKTTLLERLTPRLEELGFRVHSVTLRRGERRLPAALAELLRRGPEARDLLMVDGADQLSILSRWRLLMKSRAAGGLVVALHRPGLLPTLYRSAASPELLAELVSELLEEAGEDAAPPVGLAELYRRHGGNLRGCLRELYDVWAGRRPELPAGTGGPLS